MASAAPPSYASLPAPGGVPPKAMSDAVDSRIYGSSYSGASFASSFDPDNIAVDRHPVYSGFLVSFMVDARGGAMRGCRHSGVRIIIPPGKACMPTRVTCKLVKKEKLTHPPPLMENEALASRVLEMGPMGAKFSGPVIIEVPHFASLRGKEREMTILRSDNGETWHEHTMDASEDAIHEALGGSFEDLESAEELYQKRITRILTTDFPQYFAVVTRIRQESNSIGPEGGLLSSTVVPQVQAVFPEGSLTKKIKVGLQAQPIQPELVSKMLGNRVAVSPIVTVEPRRRKFHKPITLTIPVPKASQKGMLNQYGGQETPTLRLLCSITGGTSPAQWEDITGTTPLTFVDDCVSFTTTVSARFWLMDCQNVNEAAKMATELYRESSAVPFMGKFVVFSKPHTTEEARLRVFCMTDDRMDKTLENQEHFIEVARSRDVEVLEGKPQYIEMGGNIVPVTKSGEQLYINFHAFRENRLPMTVRVRDSNQDPVGRIAFMREPKVARGEAPQTPICNLNITLPDTSRAPDTGTELDPEELKRKYELMKSGALPEDEQISKAELRLTDIADTLQGDWVNLAYQLGITKEEIIKIQSEYTFVSEQALVMLHLWVQKNGENATGNDLERGLRKIGREDVIKNCMYNVEDVTDDEEKEAAMMQLDTGFDEIPNKTKDSSLQRGLSLDVSYDEQDMIKDKKSPKKESESAQEESGSDTGSVKDRSAMRIGSLSSINEDAINADVSERRGLYSPPEESPEQKQDRQEAYDMLADSLNAVDSASPFVIQRSESPDEPTADEDLVCEMDKSKWQEAPAQESSLPPVQPGAPVEELIESMTSSKVEGMDDRLSESSEDSMIVREDTKDADEVNEDELAIKLVDARPVESAPSYLEEEEEGADDPDKGSLKVYTDTIEGDPEVETEVQEFEETLPDGSIVKRKVIKTKQKQMITKRVVMEGPEDTLPADEEEAQAMLMQAGQPEFSRYSDHVQGDPERSSDVQEFEETLEDGTVVKRKVVTTTEQQMTTDRVYLEGAPDDILEADIRDQHRSFPDDDEEEQDEAAHERNGPQAAPERFPEEVDEANVAAELQAPRSDDEEDDEEGEMETARVVMKKQVHKKTVMRDGREETIVTEDTHVEQDQEGPEELRDSMQQVIDQFMEGGAQLGEDENDNK